MGPGSIPWSSAAAYAAHHGIIDEDEFDRFWAIVHAVDAAQLKLINPSKTTGAAAKKAKQLKRNSSKD